MLKLLCPICCQVYMMSTMNDTLLCYMSNQLGRVYSLLAKGVHDVALKCKWMGAKKSY